MKYFLIGIDGVSMRGVAKYLESKGDTVIGSDIKRGGHNSENITPDIDLVVRTSAVNPGSPGWVEVEEAKKRNIPVVKRSEFIGEIFKDKKMIAVSGMHGKTTISSMVSLVLIEAGLDPTCLIGDEVREWADVIRIGNGNWFVFEACEYDKSILDFSPHILILTNIEEEHLDTYPGGLPEILETFKDYIAKVSNQGAIIYNTGDENVVKLVQESTTEATKIPYNYDNKSSMDNLKLAVPGEHNRLNAMAVLALSKYLKIDTELVKNVLSKFEGAHRRFEKLGTYNQADLIDDYGHHPTEIKATISALKERYVNKRKIVVFWPHQYKRVKPLLEDFGESFKDADDVILKPIYFVPGRDEVLDVKSEDIAKLVIKNGTKAQVIKTDDEIVEYLKKELDNDSVLLTIGIPPVYKIGQTLVKEGK